MKATLKLVAAAAIAVSAGAANAALVDTNSGNSSMLFVLVDSTGSAASFAADLGYLYADFAPGGAQLSAGTSISWNFNNNTLTVNGSSSVVGNWASEYTQFTAANTAAVPTELSYGVLGGDSVNSNFLTTGNPTAAQVTGQNLSNVWSFPSINSIWGNNAAYAGGTLNGTNGANTVIGSDALQGFVGAPDMLGVNYNFQEQLNWQATVTPGTSSAMYYLTPDATPSKLAGTWSYNAGVLTYSVAAVPEGDGLALAMAGLGLLGFVARRRQAR